MLLFDFLLPDWILFQSHELVFVPKLIFVDPRSHIILLFYVLPILLSEIQLGRALRP